MPTPPINLGPYTINVPTEAEKGHIRDSLDLGSAALLQGSFLDDNRLLLSDPNNSSRTITLDKTLLNSAVASRLFTPRIIAVSGQVTTSTPVPRFDGTADITIPITLNPLSVSSSQLADDSVIPAKIPNGTIAPAKLTLGAPVWDEGSIHLNRGVEIGSNITADANSYIDFHSSYPLVDADARILRAPGINGTLTLSNSGSGDIVIRGASFLNDSNNTVQTSRQRVGGLELFGNQINTTAADNIEIALNFENSDSTINTFLNTTVFNGKREVSARFFGESKALETYGPTRASVGGQIGWATAGLASRASSGNALIALRADSDSATLLKHVRSGSGIQIRNAEDNAFAPLVASTVTSSGDMFINDSSPTLYLQDNDSRSAMIHVNSNIFYVLRGSGVNSTTWEAIGGRWPLEINLETNDATFGGGVNAGSFTSRSSIRYKERVSPLQDALNVVKNLHGVHYFWKDSGRPDIGLIAEDVARVVPEVVTHSNDSAVEGVDYGKLTALLIEAVKELSTRVEELEKQLAQ